MIDLTQDTKYKIDYTSNFKRQLKKMVRQNKDLDELLKVIIKLANLEELEPKYKNHKLINNKIYNNCCECHIKPD